MSRALHSSGIRSGLRRIVGMNWRERKLIEELNPRRHRILADDKVLSKELLANHDLPIPRTLAVIESTRGVEKISRIIGGYDHLVVKPARGKAGSGIAVLGPKADHGWCGPGRTVWDESDIRHLVANILMGEYASRTSDRALIEERIFAGPVLEGLPTNGLPDVRVITLHGTPVMSMVRLPTRQSAGKANLHLGALGIGIDLETGVTTGGTWRGRDVSIHPETHQALAGLRVTAWADVLETASRAARAFPLGYLGVDISVTQEYLPVVLEVNVRPGLEIQNANRRGLRPEIHRVLSVLKDAGPGKSELN